MQSFAPFQNLSKIDKKEVYPSWRFVSLDTGKRLGKLQGHTDVALNDIGILQANACANFFNGAAYGLIVTSPLERAKQTASIIAAKNKLPIVEMAHFLERSYGDAEGLTVEERTAQFPNRQYTNQEPREALIKRVMQGIQQIQQHPVNKVIVVTHGAVINSILAALSNNRIGSGKTKLANASLTIIRFVKRAWHIESFNHIAHLQPTYN